MIIAKQLVKKYGNLEVLRGVSLDIEAGEVVAIVGKSGAGKSTLLHLLGTLDRPDSGSIALNGVQISSLNAKALAAFRNTKLGFVFQFHHLLPEFTALENVTMPALIAGVTAKVANARATELLEYLQLADRLTHKPAELSGGEAQRVAVARALMNRPAIVFADEPSGNLDGASSHDLHRLFFQLRNDFNQTFVLVTHSTDLAALADRTLTMLDGALTP